MQGGDLVHITSNPNKSAVYKIVEMNLSSGLVGLVLFPRGKKIVYAHQSELVIV